jgi:4-amino-4-deoxy-L-arabinose transferase-like glycosyltransferase
VSAAATPTIEFEPPEPAPPRTRPERPDGRDLHALAPYAGLPVVLAVAAVLNLHRLSQNGYANVFYSAGVQSMLHSLHNFLFVSFDPGGLVTVDKPPVALWVQVLSAKIFGFSPIRLLAHEALAGVLSVAVLYVVLARRFGLFAALAGSAALAVYPSFVAVSRDNGVDPVLLLLMTCACATALRACESGRWRTLIACAVLVGLAFNTKTLAAYLVVPGIGLAYLVCGPGSARRRLAQLAAGGVVMLVVSFAWILFVDATPASKRPYVGSSKNNSELGLTFGYNGFGRVEGQEGGPNSVLTRRGGYVPVAQERASDAASNTAHANGTFRQIPRGASEHPPKAEPAGPSVKTVGRAKEPTPFGPSPRPLRLFGHGLGDQAAWLLPFAVFGLLALIALVVPDLRRRGGAAAPRAPRRRPPRPAAGVPARLRRLVLRRARRAQRLQGHHPPLLRLRPRARHRRNVRRRRGRLDRARPRAPAAARPAARRLRARRHRRHPARADAPRALHAGLCARAGRRRRPRPARAGRDATPGRASDLACDGGAADHSGRLRRHHLARAGRGHLPGRRPEVLPRPRLLRRGRPR